MDSLARKYPKRSLVQISIPGTSVPSLAGTLRSVVRQLNNDMTAVDNGLYHKISGSLRDRLVEYGVPLGLVPECTLLMQKLGIARCYRGSKTFWEIVDVQFFDEFVSERWMIKAYAAIVEEESEYKRRVHLESLLARQSQGQISKSKSGASDATNVHQIREEKKVEEKLSIEAFILNAIEKLSSKNPQAAKYKEPGIHVVFSNFNGAFKAYFGEEARPHVDALIEKGVLKKKPARGGIIIFKGDGTPPVAESSKSKTDEALQAILGE